MDHANPAPSPDPSPAPGLLLDPDRVPAAAFGLAEDHPSMDADWHQHRRAQLLFCVEGSIRLTTRRRYAVLPPQRAAWIPAGVEHRASSGRPVRLRTVYFGEEPGEGIDVFTAPPLLREMAVQACAWGLEAELPEIPPFYAAMRGLVERWRSVALPVDLPAASSERLERALGWATTHVGASLEEVARRGGMSTRTLQRACLQELGVPFQGWMARARVLLALELLADVEMPVGEIAVRCGYESAAAFSRAFRAQVGAAPGAFRGSNVRT